MFFMIMVEKGQKHYNFMQLCFGYDRESEIWVVK